MAMEFEGFSMREYTSRMRSLNVVNCWPFDDSDEDVVKSLLPPITVKKFTWWFDVLELSRSESIKKVENSKKKKKVREKGESSLRNQEYLQEYIEESDFDAEEFIGVAAKLKTFRGKMKPRAPKERSIKELFAVAPPVDRVSTEEDDDFCDSKEIKWGLKGKRNEKKKKKLKKPKKKIKKKINNEMDISVANKETCFKLHLQSHGVVKELDVDISDAVPIHKEKPTVKRLDAEKKTIACNSSKVTTENEKSEFPVHGNLKNRTEVFPLLKPRNCILHESILANSRRTQRVNKHVTFSDKEDIIRCQVLTKTHGSDSDTVASSLLEDHTGEVGNSSSVIETSGSEDISGGTENGNGTQSVSKKRLHCKNPSIKVMRNASSAYNNCGRLVKHLGDPGPRFTPLCFEDYPKAYNEPFAPYLYKLEKRSNTIPQFAPQSTTENHSVHAFEYQSFPHLSPKELIKFNSSGKKEFQQTMKPSIGAASSINLAQKSNVIPNCLGNHSECRSWECRTSRRDQWNLLKRNDHSFNTVERDLHPLIESYHGRQEDYQKTRNRDLVLPHLVQSKMRLMGKEVIVNGNELWKDNHTIAEHHSGGTAIDNFTSYSQNEPSLGKLKETLACLSETEINHRSRSMLQPFSQFTLQRTDMNQNDFVASKRNPVPGLHPCLSPSNSSAVHDVRSIVRDPITHGYESKIVSSEFPMPRPAFQGLPYAPRSVIRFPFMNPDLERHGQSSWPQRSPKNMSPLLFDVAERETLLSYGQSYSNLGSSYGPLPMPGTSCWTDPRVSLKRETFCLHSSFTSGSSFQKSIAPAPLTQPALVSCYSGILPNSVLQKRHGSQLKFKEPFRSRMIIRGHSHGKKARKRASAASDDSFKPVKMKMPKLGIQEASNFSMTKSMNSVYFEGEAGSIGQPFQSDFAKNKETIMACGEYKSYKDENAVLTGKDPFSSTARSGPVKLTAGAKHISRPVKK